MFARKVRHSVVALGCLAATAFGLPAYASVIYEYTHGPGTFGGVGQVGFESVTGTFDTGSQLLTWSVDFTDSRPEAAWLVLSPGANPRGTADELGIAYMDAASGNTWLYAYNGVNSSNSFEAGPLLGFAPGSFQVSGYNATLTFDATAINAQLTSGFSFGPSIGVWYHPVGLGSIVGDADGVRAFTVESHAWLDSDWDDDCTARSGCVTAKVPEPATAAMLAVGMIGVLAVRRRRVA